MTEEQIRIFAFTEDELKEYRDTLTHLTLLKDRMTRPDFTQDQTLMSALEDAMIAKWNLLTDLEVNALRRGHLKVCATVEEEN